MSKPMNVSELFQKLWEELAPFIQRWDTNYRKVISVCKLVATLLYRLADTSGYTCSMVLNLSGVWPSQ